MDSPHKLLDSSMDGLEADGRLRLPPNVTTLMAEDLRARLVLAADHEAAILIDAAAVRHSLRLAPGQWVNVQLRDDNGLSAISNPVFVRPPQLRLVTAASGPGTTRPSPARTPATTG